MRTLIQLIMRQMVKSAVGRWALTVLLLLVGAIFLLASLGTRSGSRLNFLLGGIFFTALGLFYLVVALRIRTVYKSGVQLGEQRAKELLQAGKILPIPPLPPLPRGVTEADVADVAEYARTMAALPWGDDPTIPEWEVRHVFDRTVAHVRRVTGDWRMLSEPIDTFVAMPRPLCFVGAAEVMFRLSYLQWRQYAPVGLRQGLSFAFKAQFHTPQQPDALIIQAKLLSGSTSKFWLELADKTIAMLKQVAPNHPRLPNAEVLLHEQRGEYEAALACLDRTLANPPSPEEEYVALSGKGLLLMNAKRYAEALDVYDEALARAPDDPWTWHNRSILLLNLGRYDEALESNTRALSIMDFGNARTIREKILARRAQASGSTPGF